MRAPAAVLVLLAFGAAPTLADVTGYVELQAGRADNEFALPGLPSLATRTDFWRTRARLEWRQQLWPNLTLRLGAFAEKNASDLESDLGDSETDVRRLQPYFDLRLRSDEHLAELLYDRHEERSDFGSVEPLVLLRDTWSANYGWFPRRALPQVQLQYLRTDQRDEQRVLADRLQERWLLTTEYTPHDTLYLRYRGSREDTENRVDANESETTTHNARVRFNDGWWDRRLTVSADYNVTWRETHTTNSGQGEVAVPVPAAAGLSALDDTPERDALGPNPAVADGDVTAAAGLNLGLPAPGDDVPRNIGLDFAIDRDVNTLLVWIDSELPPGISGALSWRVYTSTDNDFWTLHTALPFAPFGPFENRFELRFPDVFARYVKVVVAPLTPDVPFATDWPSILVTELQAELRVPARDFEGTNDETAQLGTGSARLRLLENVDLYYELTAFVARTDSDSTRSNLSNGLSLQYPLGPGWSVSARLAREIGREHGADREGWVYTAALTATPVATLRHSLVLSGRDESVEDLPNDTMSVFLYSTADLYRGVSLTFGAGRSRAERLTGEESDSQRFDLTATLVPHPTTTVVVLLSDTEDEIQSIGAPQTLVQRSRAGETSIAWRPLAALYFFGSWRVDDRTGDPYRVTDSYSVNWAPFRDGTLHVNLAYNAITRSDDDNVQRGFTPSLRWRLSPRSWFDLAYQKLKTENIAQRTDSEILSGTFRVLF